MAGGRDTFLVMIVGVDFGSSVTDAVILAGAEPLAHAELSYPGPASVDVLARVLSSLADETAFDPASTEAIAVTGGRSRELPDDYEGSQVVKISEPEAAARGALSLAGLTSALVVSCGTGTAMVGADSTRDSYAHVMGTPVGGGTLQAFGRLLLGGRSASQVAALAARGTAAKVDTTLADVLGGSLDGLPPTATAVSLGRVGAAEGTRLASFEPADLAAGLCTMVAQTVALIALGAARSLGSPPVVFVGRVSLYPVIKAMIEAVFDVYRYPHVPLFPLDRERATALGAALAVAARSQATPPHTAPSDEPAR